MNRPTKPLPQILMITGLSGSGKTHAARALEDVGWFCVDNLPTALIPRFAELLGSTPRLRRAALVLDVREADFLHLFPQTYRKLTASGVRAALLFLEADEKTLVRRYSETRRPHPLAVNQPAVEGIRAELEALRPIRKMADRILDSTGMTVHQLRERVQELYGQGEGAGIVISVVSFGFKHGVPAHADLLFDVRFLPNPNFVAGLKALTGTHPAVIRFLKRQPDTAAFLRRVTALLRFLLPRYVAEGKSYLTIAIGCTGGRHRSVMIAEAVAQALLKDRRHQRVVRVHHRDARLEGR